MDELIDIYDENQNFIKTEMKYVAHRLGLWHKSIHGYLINDKNEIIIQKRSADKDLYPNIWDISFAGHIGAGEDSLVTVIRECNEELGIDLNEDEIQYLFTNPEKLRWGNVVSNEFLDVFLCRKNFENIKKQDEEVADVKVIHLTDFIKMVKEKDESLFPHYEEYDKILPVLENLLKN